MNSIEKYSRLTAAEKVLTESGADSSYIEHIHQMRVDALDEVVEDGGPGSGHWGHLGILGHKGGSLKGSGGLDFRKTQKNGKYWSSAKKKQKQIKSATNKIKKSKTPEAKKEALQKKAALVAKWKQKYNQMHTPNGLLRHQGLINPKTGKPYHAKAAAKKLGTVEQKKVEAPKKPKAITKPKVEKPKVLPVTPKTDPVPKAETKIQETQNVPKVPEEVKTQETPKHVFNGGKKLSWSDHLKLRADMGQSGMSAGDYCGSPHSFSVCDWLREHTEKGGHVYTEKNGQTWDTVASCEQTIKAMDSKMRETTETVVGTRFVGKRGFSAMFKEHGISLKGNETKTELQAVADKINNKLKQGSIIIHDKAYASYSSDSNHNIYTGKQVRIVSSIAKGTKMYVSDYHHESEMVAHRDNDMDICRAEVIDAKDYHGNVHPQLILYNNLT